MRMLTSDFTQLRCKPIGISLNSSPMFWPSLHKYYGPLFARSSDADESRAIHPRVLVEDGFAGNREERAARRDDAMRFAAAEPKAIGFQISHVAHPMPERIAVPHLVQGVGVGTA